MAKTSPVRITGKKHIARAEREAELRLRILLGLGGVGLLIILVLLLGLVRTYILIPRQPVAIVEGAEVTTADYRKRVLYEQFFFDAQIAQLQNQLVQINNAFPDNPELRNSLQDQTRQQMQQLLSQKAELERTVLDTMIEEELDKQEAARRGIDVSEAEVTEAYNARVANSAGGLTPASAEATTTAQAAANENATATAQSFTPTPTLTATTAAETEAVPSPTAPPPPTPTLNVLTGDALAQAMTDWENTFKKAANMTPKDLRQVVYLELLRDKVREAIGAEAETVVEQAHVRHILVETEDEALKVKARLAAGESFEDLARELSQDSGSASKGGDLGWFRREDLVAPFAEAAFTQEIGVVGDPVETQYGWHVIEVLERGERQLEGAALTRAQRDAYDAWLTQARASSNIENLWTPDSPPPSLRQ